MTVRAQRSLIGGNKVKASQRTGKGKEARNYIPIVLPPPPPPPPPSPNHDNFLHPRPVLSTVADCARVLGCLWLITPLPSAKAKLIQLLFSIISTSTTHPLLYLSKP